MASSDWKILVGVELDTSDIQSQLEKVTGKGSKVSLDTSAATKNLNSMNKSAAASGLTLQEANMVLNSSIGVLKSFANEILTVDKSLTEFKKVSDLQGDSLDKYVKKLQVMGREVGRTGSEMIDAATEFKKSGYSDTESANLAKTATMFQNVADDAISAGDAASFIISQLKAFNKPASEATHVVDALNSVSNNFAVSSSDLSQSIGNASSAMAVGNVTYEETLGLLTAGTEITRNSNKVSRALVSVQSRYNQILDDSSSTGQKLIAFYKDHGIAIKDEKGNLRSLYDTLGDLAGKWNTLDEDQKKYFLNVQAGGL